MLYLFKRLTPKMTLARLLEEVEREHIAWARAKLDAIDGDESVTVMRADEGYGGIP